MRALITYGTVWCVLAASGCQADWLSGSQESPRFRQGKERRPGDATPEDVTGNSAFADGAKSADSVDAAASPAPSPIAPSPAAFAATFVCSSMLTLKLRTNLLWSKGLVGKFYRHEGQGLGKPTKYLGSTPEALRAELINKRHLTLDLGELQDGTYDALFVDQAFSHCDLSKPLTGKLAQALPGGILGQIAARQGSGPAGDSAVQMFLAATTNYEVPRGTLALISSMEVRAGQIVDDKPALHTLYRDHARMPVSPAEVVPGGTDCTMGPDPELVDKLVELQDRMLKGGPVTGADVAGCDEVTTPLIIDLANEGIRLSPPLSGPAFDLDANGTSEQVSWPLGTHAAFLAMDVNGNGKIDSGAELFGNHSIGPDGQSAANGFLALAKFDSDGNGRIDARDAVFARLRLWVDGNQDGVATAEELMTLSQAHIAAIELKYEEGRELDIYGNETRQRSVVRLENGQYRMIFDLWLRSL